MSFFGTIQPGYQMHHMVYKDRYAFGRAWAAVRKNVDAHCWELRDRVAFGWPRAPYARRGAITSICAHCDREFTSAEEPTGRGLLCPGCLAFEMSHRPSPSGQYQGCPANGFKEHSFRLSGGRCANCLRTKADAAVRFAPAPASELVGQQ